MRNPRPWEGYKDLFEVYSRQPIVVFAGAGATLADRTRRSEELPYGVGTWFQLLDKIVEASKDETLQRLYARERARTGEPWDLADWISRQVDGGQPGTGGRPTRFQELIINVVRGPRDTNGSDDLIGCRINHADLGDQLMDEEKSSAIRSNRGLLRVRSHRDRGDGCERIRTDNRHCRGLAVGDISRAPIR